MQSVLYSLFLFPLRSWPGKLLGKHSFSKRYAPLKVGSAESTRANLFLACLSLLKTLFSLYTWKIEVVWRRGRAWRRKKYHWRSCFLQSLYVWDVPEKETKQLRSEWVALISPFGPTNQCKKDSIDRWSTLTEMCTLALYSKLLVSSKKRTPGHMGLWRCVGWSGDMATTGLRSCQIA